VLFVGNWLPHKNVETLVRAWARLPEPRPDLVLCGSGYGPGSSVARVVAEVGGGDRVRVVGPASSDLLVVLYNGAAIFASASLYEGFCLPIVEAFACGTPVLGPAAGAVPEVAGDGALLVSPHRVDSVADGMYRLLAEEEFRRELAERGLQRSARFSWETSARRTRAVYEEVRG
jgi:glycosyltransferase involved in cell wall biosynthesis